MAVLLWRPKYDACAILCRTRRHVQQAPGCTVLNKKVTSWEPRGSYLFGYKAAFIWGWLDVSHIDAFVQGSRSGRGGE